MISLSRLVVPAFAALTLTFAAGACGSSQRCATTGDTAQVYRTDALIAAYAADGASAEDKGGGTLAVRYADLGIVLVVRANQERELVLLSSIWTHDPNVALTADWLIQINNQNSNGIVKVYVDSDLDLVTEQILHVGPGTTPGVVAAQTRVFAARSLEVVKALTGYIK